MTLITGSNEGEHLKYLREVLSQLKEYGLRLKKAKCKCLVPYVDYFRYCIDLTSLCAIPDKIELLLIPHSHPMFMSYVHFLGNLSINCPH